MAIKKYTTIDDVECVSWIDEQGEHSMTKEAYDQQKFALKTNE